jgi:Rhodopirellula transposase DDE domain
VMQAEIAAKYRAIGRSLNERQRRQWAATEAKAVGYGGVTAVWRATGISRPTIYAGLKELGTCGRKAKWQSEQIRRPGGGRKRLTHAQPQLLEALDALVEPTARGDPDSPLRWVCKSTRNLVVELHSQGFEIERQKVWELLSAMGYSMQSNRKVIEGKQHPDRDAQFKHIAKQIAAFSSSGQPTISVDTKKKELVGAFKNGGREWRPHGEPTKVKVHDFEDDQLGKAIPYGIYDIAANEGWVSIGVDHDTAQFAVASIYAWWRKMGRRRYTHPDALLITADGGGSNASRSRLWKLSLQDLVNDLRFPISVCHFPPGTSKWNRIEHRLFSQIAINWRANPLVDLDTIVGLIRRTHTDTGLRVKADLDWRTYPTGIKITQSEFDTINVQPAVFHGEWNYTILPSRAH